jgi:choline dehydrogenase/4-pyridoxate dehydrogenase
MYFAEPEATMDGRGLECARGKVIGGSSSINAMAYVRGHRGDYALGAGLSGWSYAHVLPISAGRILAWRPSYYRGGDGASTQMARSTIRWWRPSRPAATPAIPNARLQRRPPGRLRRLADDGAQRPPLQRRRRLSAAGLARRNLRVEVNALTTQLIIEGNRAVGVEYLRNGRPMMARASREVVLCGGVINSPQLLMLSGIGDPDALRALGIEVKVALRGVGKNLQDHISASVAYKRKEPGVLHKAMRFDRIVGALANAHFRGTGIATGLPAGMMAFLKTRPDAALPDIQLLFNAAPMTATSYLFPFKRAMRTAMPAAPRAATAKPRRVALGLRRPDGGARIRQNFLATESDWKTLRAGLRIARDVCRQPVMAPFMDREIAPGANAVNDADFDAHIRATGITVHHPLGTCKMGLASDRTAVVDPELRVHGVDGLRVVDGSVMPDLVGANINAPIIMIAEKAADFIRGELPLEPARIAAASEATRN